VAIITRKFTCDDITKPHQCILNCYCLTIPRWNCDCGIKEFTASV